MELYMKLSKWSWIAGLMLVAGSIQAAENYKIGVVDEVKVLETAPQAEIARRVIDKEFSPRDKDLVKMQKALKSMEAQLETDGSVMSAEAKRKLERDIRAQKRDLKRVGDEFREDLNFRRNEELTKLQRVIFQAIQDVAKGNGYDIVVGEGVVLYAGKRVDLTDKVLVYLKQQANPEQPPEKKPAAKKK